MATESDEDRISALSDRVIHRVLSFLPVREAVQTCSLARRWRGIWKSMPVLHVKDPRSWGSSEEFNKFVNHLLFFRDLTPLEELDFTTYPCFSGSKLPPRDPRALSVEPVRYLDIWIRYALMRKVRVLRVHVIASYHYQHPWLFNWPFISQHLVTLELSCVVLDGCSMDFSRCPLLEDLKIESCRISAQKMLSQSIRHLCITSCEFPDDASRLQIFAPNLFALQLSENTGSLPFLGRMPLLVTAFVELFSDNGDYCDLDPSIDCYGSEKCVALGGLSNASSLQLGINGCWEALTFEKKIDESCNLVEQFIPSEYLKIVEVRCSKNAQNVHKLVETFVGCGIPPDIISIRRKDF